MVGARRHPCRPAHRPRRGRDRRDGEPRTATSTTRCSNREARVATAARAGNVWAAVPSSPNR